MMLKKLILYVFVVFKYFMICFCSNEWGISKMVYRKIDVGEYFDCKNFVLLDFCLVMGLYEFMVMSMLLGVN